jgi:excisionase family DNA binding protein
MNSKLLKTKEVAERLDVSYRTVLKLIRLNKLKAVQVGRLLRVTEEELQKYINTEVHNYGSNS